MHPAGRGAPRPRRGHRPVVNRGVMLIHLALNETGDTVRKDLAWRSAFCRSVNEGHDT